MIRTLPAHMDYKECRILVEAAQQYHPRKTVGDAVVAIWKMNPELATILKGMTSFLQATRAILDYQERFDRD